MNSRQSFLIALLGLFLAFASARAEDAPVSLVPAEASQTSVVVRVGQHENYDRIVFDWPRSVSYKVTRDGTHAAIHFAASGTAQLRPTTHLTRGRNFTAATDADGHLTVSFELDDKAILTDFFNGNSIAMDISGDALRGEAAKPAESVAEKPKAVNAAAKKDAAISPPPVAAPSPPPADNAKPAEAATGGEKPETPKPAPPSPPVAAAPLPQAPPPAVATAPLPPQKTSRQTPSINVGTKPVLVAALDPHIALRAAVWARAGYGYIVFDKKLSLTVDALAAGQQAPTVNLQALDLAKASGFQFAIPDKVEVHASRDGSVWKIYLTKQQPDVPVSASLIAQPDFALGPRYMLPLPDAPDPVRLTDPIVGDDLIVIPLNQAQGFSVLRRMADFQIWPAAQGLVIKPLTDKIIVRSVSDGVEITSDSGLHLSSAVETGEAQQSAQKARSAVMGKSLFDFASWRGKNNESFTQARQRLQQTIVDVPVRERNRARLELARFYFARGYGPEALGLLNYLIKEVPDLAVHSDFLALLGATKILANRPDEGLKDLESANLGDFPEIKLWQAVGDSQLGNWTDAEDKFAASETLLAGYPEPFYTRFFVLAIESALAVGNNHEAADWLNIMQASQHNAAYEPAIDYLHGVLHAKAGQAQAAMQSWKIAAASHDRLYKVRAEMALIDLGVANMSLTPAQAADRLEALRFAWRGDDLEVDIMNRLGQFYLKAKNIKSALAIWGQALQLYPHSPAAGGLHDEMSQAFRDVFLGDLGKNLSPLEALTMYQQYRDTLMPVGEDGIVVTRNLAERLAAIDLMDQAGDLLEDLARNKLKGEDKGKVAARLAALRLIDRKPQQALDALDLSAGDTLPPGLQKERELLRAKALSELHRVDEALAVIKDDTRVPAKVLRADINMSSQHWEEAAKNLMDLVGPAPRPGESLREDQAGWLVRAAIAMALSDDQAGLDRLAIDYGAAMAGTSQNNTFRVLVQPGKPGQPRDITAAQTSISDVDMFQTFLNSYRKSDVGEPAKP